MGKRGPKPKHVTDYAALEEKDKRNVAGNEAWEKQKGRTKNPGADVLTAMRRKGYTDEEIQAFRIKGLEKAAANRRQYIEQKNLLRKLLKTDVQDEELTNQLLALGLEPTFGGGMAFKALCRAMTGDIDAIKYVRDTVGEKPNYDTTINLNAPVKALDMAHMTDAQLMALADQADEDDEVRLLPGDEDSADD